MCSLPLDLKCYRRAFLWENMSSAQDFQDLLGICWVQMRLIASVRNSVGILPNRTDVALQRLWNYDENMIVQRLYVFVR